MKNLAKVKDAQVAEEDGGQLNLRQKVKKRKASQESVKVEVGYLKHLPSNRGHEFKYSKNIKRKKVKINRKEEELKLFIC